MDVMINDLANERLESEMIELTQMYGAFKGLQTIEKVYLARDQLCEHHLSSTIHQAVVKHLKNYVGSKLQLFDPQQEPESEQELEEGRQLIRPALAQPCGPKPS